MAMAENWDTKAIHFFGTISSSFNIQRLDYLFLVLKIHAAIILTSLLAKFGHDL